MIPHVPKQRQHPVVSHKPFNDLVDYIEENKGQQRQPTLQLDPAFSDLLEYATNPKDKLTSVDKCIAIRTSGVNDITTAAAEMNAVAEKNARCKDSAFHVILSWPEHEKPAAPAIFDAAEHAIAALGLAEHQYVIAIHGNTDNRHCHIAVNRVHPVSFKARHIEWATKTLHFAARESEIKHGWTHDNGLYIVSTDGRGRKAIILNTEHAAKIAGLEPHAHREVGDRVLPSWHDPESLESWLKTTVTRRLKTALPKFQNWQGLHAFLDQYGIALADSGGGGMRLQITSGETGEVLELPASKGLRLLKRAALEARWGAFSDRIGAPCTVPTTSHLTTQQLIEGANRVLTRNLDPRSPYDNILHLDANRARIAAERSGRVHELPDSGLDARRGDREVLLPDALQIHVGDARSGQNPDLRRPGSREAGGRDGRLGSTQERQRNDAQRDRRRQERAAARADLRQRYSQYKRFVQQGDTEHLARVKEVQTERRKALAALKQESDDARRAARRRSGASPRAKLLDIAAITSDLVQRKLQTTGRYEQRLEEYRALRQSPLSWRTWLHEQSNLGDQAALSALRGIVYQAQRDAKKDALPASAHEAIDDERAAKDAAYRDAQYHKAVARLLKEERNEIAIRAARSDAMRPHELDALLIRYAGIQWRVTGNGNVEFSDRVGAHLFTDRGNRVTFDRQRVTDEEIKLALLHSQQKFGRQITLTGDDPVFTARMARLASDMGLIVLNPELQTAIAEHRQRKVASPAPVRRITAELPPIAVAPANGTPARQSAATTPERASQELPQALPQLATAPALNLNDALRAKVLAIDPRAIFIEPDRADARREYIGPVAAGHVSEDNKAQGFAQHIGRSQYVLHPGAVPVHARDATVSIRYRDRQPLIKLAQSGKGKGREG